MKDRSAVNCVVGWLSTTIADDDSEFHSHLTGLISICMHVCVWGWCVVLSLPAVRPGGPAARSGPVPGVGGASVQPRRGAVFEAAKTASEVPPTST